MANVILMTSEGGATSSGGGGMFVLVPFKYTTGVGNKDLDVCVSCGHTNCPYMVPFDGVVTLITITWYTYYKPYYISIYVNGVIQETVINSQAGEVLPFNVSVSVGDVLGINVLEVDTTNPLLNYGVYAGLMFGEV